MGTREYCRLKIGIAKDKSIDTKDYVLGNFNDDDKKILNNVYDKLFSVVDDFCNLDINRLMNKYNCR